MQLNRRSFLTATGAFLGTAASLAFGQSPSTVSRATAPASADRPAPDLSQSAFAAVTNQSFDFHTSDGGKTPMTLASLTVLPQSSASVEQFMLDFEGNSSAHLPEGIYEVDAPTFGTISMYITPSETDGHYTTHLALLKS